MSILDLNYNQPVNNSGTLDTGRGLTPAVFNGIDIGLRNPGKGWTYFDDFLSPTPAGTASAPGNFTLTSATAGCAFGLGYTGANGTGEGGVLRFSCAATDVAAAGADQGPTANFQGAALVPVNGQIVGFETRFRTSGWTSTGNPHILMGLIGATGGTAPIGTSGAISATPVHGAFFHAVGGQSAGNYNVNFRGQNVANDATNVISNVLTGMVVDTWYKLGFRWVVGKSCEVYVNGVKVVAAVNISKMPTALVGLCVAIESQGGNIGRLDLDWLALGIAT